jgi:GNAT superfamily N-acetyltransferase
MEIMRDITSVGRKRLAPLFANHHHLRPDIDAVLQGYCGSALANSEHDPCVAQLAIGLITFFGGDPTYPLARALVEQLSGEKIIIVADESWRALVHHVHGDRITSAPRLSYSAQSLNLDHLRQLSARVPEGFGLQRITPELAQRIGVEVDADLMHPEVFPSPADFVAHGIGFCALSGDQLVCGATSAARCDTAIEIQINTHPSYQQRGLATAVGAALVAYCLEQGLYPDWETGTDNVPSQHLAQRLGYVPGSPYEWLVLSD